MAKAIRVRGIIVDWNYDFVIEAVYDVESNVGKTRKLLLLSTYSVQVKLDIGPKVNVMPERVYQQLVAEEDVSKNAQLRETAIKLTDTKEQRYLSKEHACCPARTRRSK